MKTVEEVIKRLEEYPSLIANSEEADYIKSALLYLTNYNTICNDNVFKMTKSADYKERIKGEYLQLKDRIDKLHKTLIKVSAGTIEFKSKVPFDLLQAQFERMNDYLYTLEVRMELEGIGY